MTIDNNEDEAATGGRELIILTHQNLMAEASSTGIRAASAPNGSLLESILSREGATISPLFEDSTVATQTTTAVDSIQSDEDSRYCSVEAPDSRLDAIAADLIKSGAVEAAYVKPAAELAEMVVEAEERTDELKRFNDMVPRSDAPPATTPDFTSRQGYLNASPAGVDARYAWRFPGGRGSNVRVIDLEWGWQFTHEDLRANQGGLIAGQNSTKLKNINHGTAVIGVIGGDANGFGITGIAPDARVSSVAFSMPTAKAIRIAADNLRAGDILLLEIHRAGPRFDYAKRPDQQGYIAIEWWPDDFAAIRYAIGKGIIVVEAAGNGRQNFDDPLYDRRPSNFPSSWRNPFNPANASSQAVVVGAGAPPPGTNGTDYGPDRSRLGFSNYGRRVDAQGWGEGVTTTGYGDLQGGIADRYYTGKFSGTSSASPVVTGALACVQGTLRAEGQALLTPQGAINLLRSTGTPQTDAPGRPASQRIGNRPDLRQMIDRLVQPSTTYTGVWRAGSDPHYLWVNASWSSFTAKWQELGPKNLRLTDLEITNKGGVARYTGVWRSGKDPYYLWVNASWKHFVAKWKQLASQNLRLIDLEIVNTGGKVRYSGVWRAGKDAHYLWVNADWKNFVTKWQELSQKNLRLVDFEITRINGKLSYSGVWRQGTDAHYLWVNATWSNFVAKWQELAGQNLRLTKILRTWTGSAWRYSGIWRSGTDGYYLWANASWPSFVDKWQELSSQNLRLCDIEITSASDAAGNPTALAASAPVELDGFGGGDIGSGTTTLASVDDGVVDGFGIGGGIVGADAPNAATELPLFLEDQITDELATSGFGGGMLDPSSQAPASPPAMNIEGVEADDGDGYGGGSGEAEIAKSDEHGDGVGGGSLT